MGLTIHYTVSLPGRTKPEQVKAKLEALRQKCLDLPFKSVTDLMEFSGEACDFNKYGQDDARRWFLIQSHEILPYTYTSKGIPRMAPKIGEDGVYHKSLLPEFVIGFEAWAGEGCESANIGLCRFPNTIPIYHKTGTRIGQGGYHEDVLSDTEFTNLKVGDDGWTWHSFCKTQYSGNPSLGGLTNFLRCHLAVVAMLDAAEALGFNVKVNDEGQYWDKRDVDALAKEVGEWDALIAGFGGRLKDLAESTGMSIEAPITKRPDFEQLEAEGQSKLPPGLDAVVLQLIRATKKKVEETERGKRKGEENT